MMFLNFKTTMFPMKRQSLETVNSASRIYHYKHEHDHLSEKSRIHLRIDPDGTGTLIVNANRVLHLNPTAALMAHLILEGRNEQEIVLRIKHKYRVSASQASQDLANFNDQLEDLI